ncbi:MULTISPECIES: helix-turn-helix domain-containing protein [Micromonospora]|uniref:DNA-binding transcriptional regulator, XRE-family HTH domain n=1 Tax=Micromonospora yangpuensis TaxID=683228 RepID=A0A1C6UF02_9ACTN|nr:helix-turn-helix transcriptional regulator [Micromonospora yangpuensis]GGM06150.1 transcriptional regulator [Micromonospora yangpuensis]SCL52538.1 DNA-binding transcriptional regulator, XRE-family HTH domain [Micromonospora yangpuensis]
MTAEQPTTPGQRVERLRRAAGLSRERLAGLSSLSPTTVKFIENGRRGLTLRAAQQLAPHLGVRDLGELFGPTVALSLDVRPSHPAVDDVRRALTAWHIKIDGDPESPAYLGGAIDAAWQTWHTSRHQRTEAGLVLPGLLDSTQRAARLHEGDDRRTSLALLAQAYHLAQAYLAWHGDREMVWLTVDRGLSAALDSDDPLAIAQSIWYAAHLLRSVGRADEAVERLREARGLVEPRVADGGPEWAEMLADLHLCSALTRARSGDQGAWSDWDAARRVVERALPEGYVGRRTRVSRPLVDVYAVMCAVDLGDPDEAQRRAHALDPASIPSTERRGRHFVELARSADLEGAREATLHLLARAEATSPETVRYSPPARDIAARLAREAPAAIRAEAVELSRRIGASEL